MQSLSEHYDGPQPSDLCDLLEGEQFFAGFEKGLDICTGLKTYFSSVLHKHVFFVLFFVQGFVIGLELPFSPERPDCVEGRLCFVFYSSLKNLKEVYICAAEDHKGPVRGQVRTSC